MPTGVTRRLVLAAVAGLLGVLVGAAPASAHAVLVNSSPAADSLLQDAPTQVVLTFTESVNPVAGKVQVLDPSGHRVDRDEARASGEQLIIPLRPVTKPGTYLVTFRVISADSHPVGGAFAFSYLEVSPNGPPTAENVASSPLALWGLPVARWIGYLGLVLLVGAALVLALLWPRRLPVAGPLRAGYVGAGLVALGTVLELALQVPNVSGGGLSDVTGDAVREVFASQYGAAHLIRLGVLAAALVLLRAVARGRSWGGDRVLLAVLGVIGAATWSVSGHPSATSVPTVSVTADMIHVGAMSVWLGGLAMLIAFLLPRANETELGAIVPVWSRWAGYAVGALLLTGLAQSLLELGTLGAIVSTTYGLTLLAKVSLVAVILLVAFWSRRQLAAFEAEPPSGSPTRLRRLVIVEALVAVVVLGVTSALVQLTPGRSTAAPTANAAVQTAVLPDPSNRFILTVDLLPGRTGINELHLYATTPDGRPLTVLEWRVKADNTGAGIQGLEAVVTPITTDHASGQITLPSGGSWKFVFTLRLDQLTIGNVTTTFTVA